MKLSKLAKFSKISVFLPWLLGGAVGCAINLLQLPISAGQLSELATTSPANQLIAQAVHPANGETRIGAKPAGGDRPTLKPGSQGETVSELQAALKLLGFYAGTVDGVYGEQTTKAVSQFQAVAGLNVDGVAGADTWNRLFPPSSIAVNSANLPTTSATANANVPTSSAAALTQGNTPFPPAAVASTDLPPASAPVVDTTSPSPLPSTRPLPPNSTPQNTGGTATTSPRPTTPPTSSVSPTDGKERTTVVLPVLRKGMRGPAVMNLQERLKAIGVFKGAIDGVFGTETEAAVKAAQQNRSLNPDGVVGPMTWSALLR
jgi:peptidoglycan hydrolase-like protein with peptidoglycan-binding domain